MRRDIASGVALTAGSILSLVVMALHPTGGQVMTAAQAGTHGTAALAFAVHALAMLAAPVAFFGAIGLTQRLAAARTLSLGALVLFGFASVAVLLAATASGMLAPHLMQAAATGGEELPAGAIQAVLHYNGAVNQAYAQEYVAASSLAILLWSIAMLVTGAFSRVLAVLGCAVGAATLVMLVGGHLVLNVHGFGAVVIGQAIWLIPTGVVLMRSTPPDGTA